MKKIKKILAANRSEIAIRIFRAAEESGIRTAAIYSKEDRFALHRFKTDESYLVGEGKGPIQAYLDIDSIIDIAKKAGVDAIHPGYGFLAENANFSKICAENDIKFIGASPEMINGMGDKAAAKTTMKKAGVPTIPGSKGIIDTYEECEKIAKKVGYPVMLKATAGGGGKGMRLVWKEEELKNAWDSARTESKAAFGNDAMYMEKFIEDPRHIEIQIIGDKTGKACHLSERDCSIQRRHQKLAEETPSPFMTDKLREEMGTAAIKAAEAVKYEGVGTVEFLVDKYRKFYFMEMNTRIQVEHPVTEEVVDFDLIKEQIMVAAGIKISGKNYIPQLHAIECRINAEDPANDFRPSPGMITNFHAPGGHGVRVDTHVYANYMIPPFYDSMIAKLITVAQTREEAILKMTRALDEFVIEGIKTTIPFHQKLMKNENFQKGKYTTKFMDDFEM